MSITHKSFYSEEYEGYNSGEGFGRKITIPDGVEFFNVENSFEEFLEEFFQSDLLEIDLIKNLNNIILYSTDVDTGEELELSFPNEYVSKNTIESLLKKHLDSFNDNRLHLEIKNIENEIDSLEKKLSISEEEAKKSISKEMEIKNNTELIFFKKMKLQDTKRKLLESNNFDTEMLEALNEQIKSLTEQQEKISNEISYSNNYMIDTKVSNIYDLLTTQRKEDLINLKSLLQFFKDYTSTRSLKNKKKKSNKKFFKKN